MPGMRARAAAGLKVGDEFRLSRTFTDQDVLEFAKLSGDYNPVHFDTHYAQMRAFKGPIAHGLLTASLVTQIGGQIGWLATTMQFEFKRPVYAGDTVSCHWLIAEIDERGHAMAEVQVLDETGDVVLQATTRGVLPSPRQREHLREMLAQGDPSNGAGTQ